MPDIVLTTLNARYSHSAFGLRYLLANLGPFSSRASILEFDIKQRPIDIAESLLLERPRVVAIGVYIWNVAPATELVALLKRIAPEVLIILGGPEVSHETTDQPIVQAADYVITGEADLAFRELCEKLLTGERPPAKVISAPLPQPAALSLPYSFYTDADIAHRVLYVEASRGCPFSCEFCLSSLDVPVRQFPLESFLHQMDALLSRGATQLKFVDRTFNLVESVGSRILEFLLERYRPGCFFHFELIPDRLPPGLRKVIQRFPRGALQFEVGVQTFNPEVASLISRRQDYAKLEDNFRFLRQETGVHLHADLIAGLPGESLDSFASGFDRLLALKPQEIQVGILKRLRGTPIARHTEAHGMVYSPLPPYEILRTDQIDFPVMQRLRRFARYWDLVSNSGNFLETAPLIWSRGAASPFGEFMRFSDWLFARKRRTDSISLSALAEELFTYLTGQLSLAPDCVARSLGADYQRGGRTERPEFLAPFLPIAPRAQRSRPAIDLPKRQARHLA